LRTAELLGPSAPGAGQRPRLLVWRTYWVDGRWVAGDAETKLRAALGRLMGHGDDAAVLLLYADAEADPAAQDTLAAFAQAHLGDLEALLREARDAR
jgi:EpsI family protein